MKVLDRFISFLFTLVVIILAVIVLLEVTDFIGYGVIDNVLKSYVFVEDAQMKLDIAILAVLVVLLGLKVTVFTSDLSTAARKNITVNTDHGKIQIAQETIEGIATNVIKNYDQIKDVQAKMAKAKKGINMYMMLTVYQDAKIKDLVSVVQNEVKKQIETTTNVKVCNVDVKIKNILSSTSTQKNNGRKIESVPSTESTVADIPNTSSNGIPEGYKVGTDNVLYKVEPNLNADHETKVELPQEANGEE